MYTNPFNRKHSTIRQVIDRFLNPEYNNNRWGSKNSTKEPLKRYGSNSSQKSCSSTSSKGSKSSTSSFGLTSSVMGLERRTISVGK